MSPALDALLGNAYVIFAGWVLFLVLWETTVVAVIFAVWRLTRGGSRAEADYSGGLVALSAAVAIAAVLPLVLAAWPSAVGARNATLPARSEAPLLPSAPSPLTSRATALGRTGLASFSVPFDAIAAAAALAWAAGVVLLAVRLLGGWLLTRRLARRARPVTGGTLTDAAADAASRAGVHGPFELLESPDVEAPVVLRSRVPLLLVPQTALPRLGLDHVSALLMHEFAHIRRHDYLVNFVQSIVELMLFFSPAVLWISRRIREAREFCCDDAAVAQCGDRVTYIEALTTLAALGTANGMRAAQSISGPRLITRVRRLLKEEPMPQFTIARASALALALVALVVSGIQLSAASAARTPRRLSGGPPAQARVPNIPSAYSFSQDGSGVTLHRVVIDDGVFASAEVENISTEAITAIRFLAAVERRSAGVAMPVRLFVTEDLPVSVAPKAAVTITANVLTRQQLDDLARETPGARLQTFYALQAVRFANGSVWEITPNRDASSGSDVIGSPRALLPRAFLEQDAAKAPVPGAACLDDRNRTYSPGAIVPVLNEPGHFVRCTDARWVASPAR